MNEVMIRKLFPYFDQDKHYSYLDSAASALRLRAGIEKECQYLQMSGANIHRGVYQASMNATQMFEETRTLVAKFLNSDHREIIFTSGTTDSINLLANSVSSLFGTRDEIILSEMEHHSNLVPWQLLAEKRGYKLKFIPVLDNGDLDLEAFGVLISERTALVSLTHVSNVLGTVNPVEHIIALAHKHGALVALDGAQAVAHLPVNVKELDVDFYAFSSHKIYGPSGVGILYGKQNHLEKMPPWKGGGDMISEVTLSHSTWAEVPHKFEAGTANVSGIIGFGSALATFKEIGFSYIQNHDQKLLQYAKVHLQKFEDVKIIGSPKMHVGALSFLVGDIHPHDVGTFLDHHHVAVRTGHHCCSPLMDRLNISGTVRASFGIYTTTSEIDRLVESLVMIKELFQ